MITSTSSALTACSATTRPQRPRGPPDARCRWRRRSPRRWATPIAARRRRPAKRPKHHRRPGCAFHRTTLPPSSAGASLRPHASATGCGAYFLGGRALCLNDEDVIKETDNVWYNRLVTPTHSHKLIILAVIRLVPPRA